MLELLIVVLLVLWLGGLSFGGGNVFHALLVIVIILIAVKVLRGERV